MFLSKYKRDKTIIKILPLIISFNLLFTGVALASSKKTVSTLDVGEFADSTVLMQLEAYGIPGAVVSIVKDGEVILSRGYGYSGGENKKLSDEDTLYRIGSITKLFTWTAVMQLAEQGRLDLKEDINKYLKSFKIPERYRMHITLEHLMTHTAGFEDRLSNLFAGDRDKLVPFGDFLSKNIPERIYAPGEIIAYSNYGAALAGYIVEEVSGMKYEDYIVQNILGPLGMDRTNFEQSAIEASDDNIARGHIYENGSLKAYNDPPVHLIPAGAMSSTARDMAKFMIAHLQNGKYKDARILNESTAKEMHMQHYASDPRIAGICYGFIEWNRNNKRIIWHSGGSALFKSLMMLIPEENVGVFISYNSPDSDNARSEFRQAFLDRYYPVVDVNKKPLAGYKERAKVFEGIYMEGRTALTTSDKLMFAASRSRAATADKDGTIKFRDTKYIEVEPLVFKEVDGQGTLIFKQDGQGKITHAFQDFEPHEAYFKIKWYESMSFYMAVLSICMLIFLSFIIIWPFMQRRKEKESKGDAIKVSEAIAVKLLMAICILNILFPAGTIAAFTIEFISNPLVRVTGVVPILFKLSLFPPLVADILTVGAIVFALWSFKNRWWEVITRIHYTITVMASITFILWMDYWNILGFFK